MMQIEQCRNLGRQSMRISESAPDEGHTDFREQMLMHNRIEGLLPFEIISENGMRIYEYQTTGLENLKSLCGRRKLRAEQLGSVLTGLLDAVGRGREFMLLEDDYVITPETIYTDGAGKTATAYFSGYGKTLREQFRKLSEYLMDNIDYRDDDAVLMIYSFCMKTKEESCTIGDLWEIAGGERSGTADKRKRNQASSVRDTDKDESRSRHVYTEETESGMSDTGKTGNMYGERSSGPVQWGQDAGRDTHRMRRERDPADERKEKHDMTGEERAAKFADSDVFREIRPEQSERQPALSGLIKTAPKRLVAASVLVPAAAAALIIIMIRTGLLINSHTLRPDVLKTLAAVLAGAVLTAAAERKMWDGYLTAAKESIASAAAESDEATLLLCGDGTAEYPFSLVSDEYPAITASRFPFFVGKDPKTVDYVLNRAGVSRYHMKIDREGEQYMISDLASTNGTYLNGVRLEPYRSECVRRGDEIRIGACIFYCN